VQSNNSDMPIPKNFTKKQAEKFKRCEKELKGRKGINRFAVCNASISKAKKK